MTEREGGKVQAYSRVVFKHPVIYGDPLYQHPVIGAKDLRFEDGSVLLEVRGINYDPPGTGTKVAGYRLAHPVVETLAWDMSAEEFDEHVVRVLPPVKDQWGNPLPEAKATPVQKAVERSRTFLGTLPDGQRVMVTLHEEEPPLANASAKPGDMRMSKIVGMEVAFREDDRWGPPVQMSPEVC